MSEVITWSVVGGSIVFVIGLISAIGSRRQRKSNPRIQVVIHEQKRPNPQAETIFDGAMSMAARGAANGKENFASVGNHSR